MQEKILDALRRAEPVFFPNPHYQQAAVTVQKDPRVEEARHRLDRFAPFLSAVFPEVAVRDGRIESPLRAVPYLAQRLRETAHFSGNLWLKEDAQLPVSGSIKARGGIYEVLHFAEQVALRHGKITPDTDYSFFLEPAMQKLLSSYEVSVGSTGNLGLSIGIIGRALGFSVTVHMSADARQWKKDRLRAIGARVVEYKSDYEEAVRQGRAQAAASDTTHFVDDENSEDLFLGYAVAGERLKEQIEEKGIPVDEDHPLFVYLPCGVGGGPGGVAYGIQNALGAHAHCLFVEPVQAPCMLLSILTQTHGEMSISYLGLHGRTEADGLAVGRASALVSRCMSPRLDALYTVPDEELYRYMRLLHESEGIYVEPSAAASFSGPSLVEARGLYPKEALSGANHILWATGGGMVPEEEKRNSLQYDTGSA